MMILALLVVIITIFVPPKSAFIVGMYIILITILGYIISTYLFPFKFQLLVIFGIVIFLAMNTIVGFSFLNTLLLLSLIVTISQLVKKNKRKV